MAFLPQEFAGAQEHARAHFPAHDIRPLIDLQRQVAPALHPAAHRRTDDGFRRRADDQRLFQLRLGIGNQLPFPSAISRWWVTTAISFAKPSTWSARSDEHTSELQSLMRISYAVFCL